MFEVLLQNYSILNFLPNYNSRFSFDNACMHACALFSRVDVIAEDVRTDIVFNYT